MICKTNLPSRESIKIYLQIKPSRINNRISYFRIFILSQYQLNSKKYLILEYIKDIDFQFEFDFIRQNILNSQNRMLASDNNSSALLLAFVNQEFQSEHPYFYDFKQLKNSSFIYSLLQKIHTRYFSKLNHLSFDFTSYLTKIEGYLMEFQGKRLSRKYKKRVAAEKSVEDIIKLVMYLLLQSHNKTYYISRIVELSVDIQTFLMQQIQQITNSLQNFVEIKDIMIAIENLEEENEALKDKLKSYYEINQKLAESATEIKQQNINLEHQIKKYEAQKKQVFDELHIRDLKEYIEIYKSMKQENQELNLCIEEIQEKKREIEQQNQIMLEKITGDCRIINSLNEEIKTVKQNYYYLKDQTINCSLTQIKDDANILRENKNINNVKKQRHSIETKCSTRRSQLANVLDEDAENSNIRFYNQQIMQKFEQARKVIKQLMNEAETLRDENITLAKEQVYLDRKINDIQNEQARFAEDIHEILR